MRITRAAARVERISPKITPMIDVVFLLIIFFMCVSEMSRMEIEALTLPGAVSGVPDGGGARLTVNLLRDGSCRVGGERYAPGALRALIGRRAIERLGPNGTSNLAVRIRADADAPYQHVQRVMQDCRRARVWSLSFAVAPGEGR
jgi:biopolymer transport protein ExbD